MGWIKIAIPSFPPYEKYGSPVPQFHRHTSKSSQHFGKKPQHHSRNDYIVDE
jgi:hypothetical protein